MGTSVRACFSYYLVGFRQLSAMLRLLVLAVLCFTYIQATSPRIDDPEVITDCHAAGECPEDCGCGPPPHCEILAPCWNGEGELPELAKAMLASLPVEGEDIPSHDDASVQADAIQQEEAEGVSCPVGCHCENDGTIIDGSCWHPDHVEGDVFIKDLPPLAVALLNSLPVVGEAPAAMDVAADAGAAAADDAADEDDAVDTDILPEPECGIANCAICRENLKKCYRCEEGYKLKRRGKKCKKIKGGRRRKEGYLFW